MDDFRYPFLQVDFELKQSRGAERSQRRRTVAWAKRKRHPTRQTVLTQNEREKLLDRREIDMQWLEALTDSVGDGEVKEASGSGGQEL